MKQLFSRLKPYLRWVIFGSVLFFLLKALKDHWQEVAAIRIDQAGWYYLAIALLITLTAHTWGGLVWSWLLREFKHPLNSIMLIQVYLQTNIAKYLPGNIWHYYGRISTLTKAGVPTPTATLSVLIEPILQASAAVLFVLIGSQIDRRIVHSSQTGGWQILFSLAVLLALHPWVLNPILHILEKFEGKYKKSADETVGFRVERYPLIPLLGAIGFLGLRGVGFCFILFALTPFNWSLLPMVLSSFSLAWVTALIVPGAPGGMGVFEAMAIALLNQPFSTGVIFSAAALYRLISIIAETGGAGLAWLNERRCQSQLEVKQNKD